MHNRMDVTMISRNFADLTHLVSEDMPVYPGEPRPRFQPIRTIRKDGVNVTKLVFGSHTGTHVDAPSHFILGADSVDKVPIENFVGEALILDVSKNMQAGYGNVSNGITDSDLELFSEKMLPDDILLLYTGTSDRWRDNYDGSAAVVVGRGGRGSQGDGDDDSGGADNVSSAKTIERNFSYLEPSAANWLIRRGIKCVGIDSPSVEKYGSKDGLTHKKLLSAGIGIIENLNSNLKKFNGNRMFLVCLPLLLDGVDAAPARAVLFEIVHDGDGNDVVDDDDAGNGGGGSSITFSSSSNVNSSPAHRYPKDNHKKSTSKGGLVQSW